MYLIDGYNLLYQTTLETREELIEKINTYCRHNNKKAVVIFDGFAPEDLSSDVVVVKFVGDADQEIIKILQENENPNAMILISSDKELIYMARQNKVNVIQSEHFNYIIPSDTVSSDEKPDQFLTDTEVKEQLKEFNYFKNNE